MENENNQTAEEILKETHENFNFQEVYFKELQAEEDLKNILLKGNSKKKSQEVLNSIFKDE